jgi:hypothetical protein
MSLQEVGTAVFMPFNSVRLKFFELVPQLIGAVVLLVCGALIAKVLRELTEKVLIIGKLDTIREKTGVSDFIYKIGLGRSPAVIIGFLVYWLILMIFIVCAAEVLKFTVVSELLNKFILFIPRLIAAIFALAIGIIFGNFLDGIVAKIAYANKVEGSDKLGKVAKSIIIIFASVIALEQLEIGTLIVSDTLRIILLSFALACGLAFGIGGKDIAADILKSLFKKKEE